MDIKKIGLLVGPFVLLMSMTLLVQGQAVPEGIDTLTVGESSRFVGNTGGSAVTAQAGNVTALVMSDVAATTAWQGYFGNITGRIVLDDAGNNSLFAWDLVNPQGEVYATNNSGTVLWANATCLNMSFGTTTTSVNTDRINLSSVNAQFGINDTDLDAFNYTFNQSFDGELIVGPRTLNINPEEEGCPQANSFVNGNWQNASFAETIIHDNLSSLIFVAILETNTDGFKSGGDDLHDFQMLVAEDGRPGGPDVTTSTYYFYVELE